MCFADRIAYTCCFLGHREIKENAELSKRLCQQIEHLITVHNVHIFLFGSKSQFNSLCYKLVTELKEKYAHINRIYVRAEFPVIDDSYAKYLLDGYEDTYYPQSVLGAGRAAYIKRNYEMIDHSRFCIFCCEKAYTPKGRTSGTKRAFDYATKRQKIIYNFPAFADCKFDTGHTP